MAGGAESGKDTLVQAQRHRGLSWSLLGAANTGRYVGMRCCDWLHTRKKRAGEWWGFHSIPIFLGDIVRLAFFHNILSLVCWPGAG